MGVSRRRTGRRRRPHVCRLASSPPWGRAPRSMLLAPATSSTADYSLGTMRATFYSFTEKMCILRALHGVLRCGPVPGAKEHTHRATSLRPAQSREHGQALSSTVKHSQARSSKRLACVRHSAVSTVAPPNECPELNHKKQKNSAYKILTRFFFALNSITEKKNGLIFYMLDPRRGLVGSPSSYWCWEQNTDPIHSLAPL